MKGNVRLMGVLVLAILVLVMVSVQVVGAETAQTWYFTPTDIPTGWPIADDGTAIETGDKHLRDEIMNKTEPPTGTYKYVAIYKDADGNHTAWWYAENAAQCDLGFGEHNWVIHIYHEKIDDEEAGKVLYADVYKVASDGTVTHLAGGNVITATGDPTERDIVCYDNGSTYQDFVTGERLGIRISGNFTTTDKLTVYYYYGNPSNLTSPATDPGYPVPELSTLILFSTGLFTLAGYVLLTRRRK